MESQNSQSTLNLASCFDWLISLIIIFNKSVNNQSNASGAQKTETYRYGSRANFLLRFLKQRSFIVITGTISWLFWIGGCGIMHCSGYPVWRLKELTFFIITRSYNRVFQRYNKRFIFELIVLISALSISLTRSEYEPLLLVLPSFCFLHGNEVGRVLLRGQFWREKKIRRFSKPMDRRTKILSLQERP